MIELKMILMCVAIVFTLFELYFMVDALKEKQPAFVPCYFIIQMALNVALIIILSKL